MLGRPLHHYRPKKEYYKRPITRSANWKCFLLHQLDERETLYTIKFTKICQKPFSYSEWTKWNTVICETSTKLEISIVNVSFCNFYPNLPKTSFKYKISKNKAHNWIEHLLNTRNENCKWSRPFCNFTQIKLKLF